MLSLFDVLSGLERWRVRYLSYVLVGDGCWGWTGHHTHDGYSRFSFSPGEEPEGWSTDVYAHIAMYRMLVGEIPDGKELDHMCRNRGCVNHDHLEVVSHGENLSRREMLCRKGHRIEGDNRIVLGTKGSGRQATRCRYCYVAYIDKMKADRKALGKKRGRPRKV
jgi:hypothetical protein